ncbi:MAG: AraC family transcriptional regulator [Fusobacteriaceae bacterium]
MEKKQLIKLFSEINKEELLKNDNKIFLSNKKNFSSKKGLCVFWENILKEDEMISVRKHTRFSYIPYHNHNYIELVYVLKGHLSQNISDKNIVLTEGELIFLNQGIYHEIFPTSKNDLIINVIIRPDFFESIFEFICFDGKIKDFFLESIFSYNKENGLIFRCSDNLRIQNLIYDIISELILDDKLSHFKIKLQLSLLIVELARNTNTLEELQPISYEKNIIHQTINYIENNYKTASLGDISTKLNIRNYSLSKLIKKEFNLTFKQIVQNKRLKKAKELVENSSLSITEICEFVGYSNWSYFYKIFKKKYYCTPNKFRG